MVAPLRHGIKSLHVGSRSSLRGGRCGSQGSTPTVERTRFERVAHDCGVEPDEPSGLAETTQLVHSSLPRQAGKRRGGGQSHPL